VRRPYTVLTAVPVLVTLGLLLTPATAVPVSRIALSGASSGSHLRLSADAGRIVVDGHLAKGRPAGCHRLRHDDGAVCPLSGVHGIEIKTGASGDFVQVLDRLPFPLTVYLGGGSDKFIGNGEADTCYPQGARRNRCVGGGGNDICITGPRNSDCVGGPGRDYCKTGAGSDGCWGGGGSDVCVMGAGEDGCHGGPGNDRLYGGPGADQLYGGPGFDYCDGGPGRGKSHGCEAGPRH
jgi:hemolysin type calcium-binding protein